MARPQSEVRTNQQGLGYRGRDVLIDDFPERPAPLTSGGTVKSQFASWAPTEGLDYTSLNVINQEIIDLRRRLALLRQEQDRARRDRIIARREWQHARNLALISIAGGTEATRTALADLQTEEQYSAFLVADGVYEEINQHSRETRTDLDALKELSNNLRRQYDLAPR